MQSQPKTFPSVYKCTNMHDECNLGMSDELRIDYIEMFKKLYAKVKRKAKDILCEIPLL